MHISPIPVHEKYYFNYYAWIEMVGIYADTLIGDTNNQRLDACRSLCKCWESWDILALLSDQTYKTLIVVVIPAAWLDIHYCLWPYRSSHKRSLPTLSFVSV